MAKLKFNELELEVPLDQPQTGPSKDEQIKELTKMLGIDKLRQNYVSLSKNVSGINNQVLAKEKQLLEKIEQNRKMMNLDNKVVNVETEVLESQIQNVQKSFKEKVNSLVSRIEEVEKRKPEQVINQEVKEVTVHHDHREEIDQIKTQLINLKEKREKVVRIQPKENKLQKNLNIALTIGLIASLLLHIL